ncbi:50S ribosomal protein L9 [Actinomycetaceae bacterium MB13-C1-2]|nr:50S ribosomal protein L9 [Actinomycetaceae bacterium MB13-C1-2]
MTTKLILNRDVERLGQAGDVVEVKDGYARNYLVPRGFATRWTKGAQRHIDQTLEQLRKREIASVEDAIALRERIEESPVVVITKKAGSTGRLFGAVTGKDIAAALAEKFSVPFDPRNVDTTNAIKATGSFPATVKLLGDVVANVEVTVEAAE